jgi:hypothetical protein
MFIIRKNLGTLNINVNGIRQKFTLGNVIGKELPNEVFEFYKKTNLFDRMIEIGAIEEVVEKTGKKESGKKNEPVRHNEGGESKDIK